MLSDPISDFLNRLKNGSLRNHETVMAPSSKLKVEILNVLKHAGFITSFDTMGKGKFPRLVVKMKPDTPLAIRRISKPGRRVYVDHSQISAVRSGLGIQILSTSRGVMSNKQARAEGIGGEVLCEAYAM